ncbi:MAG: Alpha/Beta hydrolase protein [Linnemannia gamsii]|nr:MAG: Alpha/Beta hydrolase protein [Linnemannia gamsii]
MALLTLTRVSALAIILLPLIAIQNRGTGPSSIVSAAPAVVVNKRLFAPKGPLSDAIDGAHILLQNDVDSATAKYSFLLLSKPRNYQDAATACNNMFDTPFLYVPGSPAAKELNSLLKSNAVAQSEVAASTNYWVFNAPLFPGFGCFSLNKDTEKTQIIPCTKELPIICFNSAPPRTVLIQDTTRRVDVNTAVGAIQGFRDQNSFRFLGIRYAEAPVGKLRFAAPVPRAPFTSTFDATAFGYVCPQVSSSGVALLDSVINGASQSEDCLGLNVFTPSLKSKGAKGLPVMVYIHGGGFTTFAGSTVLFEPGNLVSRGGVVVVTINYRLGMLGFTENSAFPRSEIPGNQAIHDQILALRWVKNHITNFGGDPARVTVVGESAGALTTTSSRPILAILSRAASNRNANIMWGTTKDEAGRFLEDYISSPYAANTGNYDQIFQGLLGAQRQETLIHSGLIEKYQPSANSQELLNYFCTAYYFYCPLQFLSRQITAARLSSSSSSNGPSPRIYNFRFDHGRSLPLIDTPGKFCGSDDHICHAKDIIPTFGSGTALAPFATQTGDDARFSRQIIDRVTSFAKTGDPNPTAALVGVENSNADVMGVQWLPYDDRNSILELNLHSKMSAVDVKGGEEEETSF